MPERCVKQVCKCICCLTGTHANEGRIQNANPLLVFKITLTKMRKNKQRVRSSAWKAWTLAAYFILLSCNVADCILLFRLKSKAAGKICETSLQIHLVCSGEAFDVWWCWTRFFHQAIQDLFWIRAKGSQFWMGSLNPCCLFHSWKQALCCLYLVFLIEQQRC